MIVASIKSERAVNTDPLCASRMGNKEILGGVSLAHPPSARAGIPPGQENSFDRGGSPTGSREPYNPVLKPSDFV